ncbi:hypothetical protein [Streptomyces lincolnensis]|uniref:hypothetical protein n=1 Tax=Streptomyces lincolnensis TaxID=1915 RepID=UPI000835EBC1|nr:hypothetical protein [Streptomyces lincolnensis]QMV06783.1 hypothetical protein GJU35_14575 [Streptomyces lincolnensis]
MMIRRRLTTAALGLAASGALIVTTAGAAHAVSVSFGRAGVEVATSWDWSANSLTDIDYSIKDKDCDGNDVYARMRVYTKLVPDGTDTTKRYNSNGCGKTVKHLDLRFDATNHITGIRVYACVDDAGSDSCSRSDFYDNPKVP